MVVKLGLKEWKYPNSCFERAFEQLAGFSEVVEKSVFKVFFPGSVSWFSCDAGDRTVGGGAVFFVCQERVQQRTVEQLTDIPEVVEEPFFVVFRRKRFNSVMLSRTCNMPWISSGFKRRRRASRL